MKKKPHQQHSFSQPSPDPVPPEALNSTTAIHPVTTTGSTPVPNHTTLNLWMTPTIDTPTPPPPPTSSSSSSSQPHHSAFTATTPQRTHPPHQYFHRMREIESSFRSPYHTDSHITTTGTSSPSLLRLPPAHGQRYQDEEIEAEGERADDTEWRMEAMIASLSVQQSPTPTPPPTYPPEAIDETWIDEPHPKYYSDYCDRPLLVHPSRRFDSGLDIIEPYHPVMASPTLERYPVRPTTTTTTTITATIPDHSPQNPTLFYSTASKSSSVARMHEPETRRPVRPLPTSTTVIIRRQTSGLTTSSSSSSSVLMDYHHHHHHHHPTTTTSEEFGRCTGGAMMVVDGRTLRSGTNPNHTGSYQSSTTGSGDKDSSGTTTTTSHGSQNDKTIVSSPPILMGSSCRDKQIISSDFETPNVPPLQSLNRHASIGATMERPIGGTPMLQPLQKLPPYHHHHHRLNTNITGSRRSIFSLGSSVRSKTSQFSMANSSRGGSTAAELEWLYNNHPAAAAVVTSNSRQSSASYSCMSLGSSRSNYSASVRTTTLRQTLSQYSSLSAKTSTQSRSSTPPDLIRNITNATVRQLSHRRHSVEGVVEMRPEPQVTSTATTTSPTAMMLMTTTTTTVLTSEQPHEQRRRRKKTKKQAYDHRHHQHRDRPENPIVLQMMEEYCACDNS